MLYISLASHPSIMLCFHLRLDVYMSWLRLATAHLSFLLQIKKSLLTSYTASLTDWFSEQTDPILRESPLHRCLHNRLWQIPSSGSYGRHKRTDKRKMNVRQYEQSTSYIKQDTRKIWPSKRLISQGRLTFTNEGILFAGDYKFCGFPREGKCYHILFELLIPMCAITWSTLYCNHFLRFHSYEFYF